MPRKAFSVMGSEDRETSQESAGLLRSETEGGMSSSDQGLSQKEKYPPRQGNMFY